MLPLSVPVSLIWSWPHLQTTENDSPVSQGCGGYALRLQSADPMGLSVMKCGCLGVNPPLPPRPRPERKRRTSYIVLPVCFKRSWKRYNLEPFGLKDLDDPTPRTGWLEHALLIGIVRLKVRSEILMDFSSAALSQNHRQTYRNHIVSDHFKPSVGWGAGWHNP